MNFRALILSACLLATPALAAGPLDALRAQARSTREQVSQVRSEQLSLRNDLSRLSTRIEALKAQARGALVPGSELDGALKNSQQLSDRLSALSRSLSERQAGLETAQLALLEGLSSELASLRRQFDGTTDRSTRRAVVEQMKALRGERDALRATLPAARLPTLDMVRPSEDPAELLEQADLARDHEEKVRRELKLLEQRLKEKKDEAELDRRLQRFVGEESLFDDQDRRLRLQRTTVEGAASTTTAGKSAEAPASGTSLGAGSATDGTGATPPLSGGAGTPSSNGFNSPSTGGGADPAGRGVNGSLDSASVRVTTGSDSRVQVGGSRPIATGDEDDLDDLELQRARLQGLAAELKKRAEALEKKAAELK